MTVTCLSLVAAFNACSDDDDGSDPGDPDSATPLPDGSIPTDGALPGEDGSIPEPPDSSTGEPDGGLPDAGDAGEEVDAAMDGGLDIDGAVPDDGAAPMDAGDGLDAGDQGPGAFRPVRRDFSMDRFDGLTVRDGFEINVFAAGMQHARMLATHGDHVYLTRPMQGDVVRFVDDDGDGEAEVFIPVATGMPGVHGIGFSTMEVYLATPDTLYRGAVDASGNFQGLIEIADLPYGGQHPNRTLGIGPDSMLYVSVGSSCDACMETDEEHATMLRSAVDGTSREIFASGLRNTLAFDWHPTTGALWGMDQGSDWRGDDLPPEELNLIMADEDYGWPYCYGNQVPDPIIEDPPGTTKEAYCADTEPAVLEVQAHGSPIAMSFYTSAGFPAEFFGTAFLTLRGSWNRIPPTGYKVVQVHFDASGDPTGVEDFVSGFLIEEGRAQFGRPAGLTVAPDGALLFSDDENGMIYRVTHESAGQDAGD